MQGSYHSNEFIMSVAVGLKVGFDMMRDLEILPVFLGRLCY